jgi:dihydropteroate synthase
MSDRPSHRTGRAEGESHSLSYPEMNHAPKMLFRTLRHQVWFPRRPLVMGIVNINDDSFSGDGSLNIDQAIAQAAAQIGAGADIIDVGGESARTNRAPISVAEEISRLRPFVTRFAKCYSTISPGDEEQVFPPMLSLNTWRPEVLRALLPLGIDIVNDISALTDPQNAALAAEYGAALVIMHSVGEPKVPHRHMQYADIMQTLDDFFERKIAEATKAGLSREAIILDPGIDFAKQRPDNLRIYLELDRLSRFERPILLPVSRKTVIGEVLDLPEPKDRDPGTIACVVAGMQRGAHIFRVHNVNATSLAIRAIWSVLG